MVEVCAGFHRDQHGKLRHDGNHNVLGHGHRPKLAGAECKSERSEREQTPTNAERARSRRAEGVGGQK
jgi:hypothetical protein